MSDSAKDTILFVDDEQSILDVACTFFKMRGYKVLTACNGKKAMEILNHNQVDCCFTDINMPEMDGLALAEHIRKHDNTLPVVVMTGYPSLENTIHTLKNGVVDFLIKPVNLNQLELCVQRVMRERKLFIENLLLSKEVAGKERLEKLNVEMAEKIDELNIVNRILNDFNVLRESRDVFNQLVQTTTQVVQADVSHFYLLSDTDNRAPVSIAKAGPLADNAQSADELIPFQVEPDVPENGNLKKLKTLLVEAGKDDQALLIASNRNGSQYLPEAIHSYMLVPLKIKSKTLGFLSASAYSARRRFNEKDLYYLSFMMKKAEAAIENLALYENIYSNLLATLYAFVKAIEARDPYTKQHSNRVTILAMVLAKAMGATAEEQDILHVSGMLHDIGKIGIPDNILLKPDRLDKEEYRVIQQHPVIGSEIMDHLGLWTREKQIVRCHHERFDGKGYPDGLAGNEIPKLARILSVADVYDAIASDRAYRSRMEEDQILDIMYSGSGSQFDPEVVSVFRELYKSGEIARVLEDSDGL